VSKNKAELAVSVVIPTHNPRVDYLARVIDALRGQTLPCEQWELVVVDNCSQPALVGDRSQATGNRGGINSREKAQDDLRLTDLKLKTAEVDLGWHANARVVREEKLGLTFARLLGFAEAKGELIVMVDDDNVLAPDYLANAVEIASRHPDIGAFGGKCLPEFETELEPWMREFLPLLALRDHGEEEVVSGDIRSADGSRRAYPDRAAPIGAGMVLRRDAAAAYAERIEQRTKGLRDQGTAEWLDEETKRRKDQGTITDRKGNSLASAGDNDLVFQVLRDGWKVGYFPQLVITHLIPAGRLTVDYLARANRGIQRSWAQVLRKHDACPWPKIPGWSLPLRKAKAWVGQQPWRNTGSKIRLAGVIGRLEGLISE
jgi:glycosyltransferase involved in cell wall biosynthesis